MKVENTDFICYILMLLVALRQGNVKKFEESMKIFNTGGENHDIFWTSLGNSIKEKERSDLW